MRTSAQKWWILHSRWSDTEIRLLRHRQRVTGSCCAESRPATCVTWCLVRCHVGNALWALAKLGHSPGAGLLAAAAPRLTALLPDATPQNVANWLVPYVAFEAQPPTDLLDGVVAVMESSPEVCLQPTH